MRLEDRLRICLLALESRYPDHVVSANTALLGDQYTGVAFWSASEMIDYLEHAAPDLLDEMAVLVIDIQQSDIYLLNCSDRIPALFVHCQGRIPARQPSRPLIERITTGPLVPTPPPQPGASA